MAWSPCEGFVLSGAGPKWPQLKVSVSYPVLPREGGLPAIVANSGKRLALPINLWAVVVFWVCILKNANQSTVILRHLDIVHDDCQVSGFASHASPHTRVTNAAAHSAQTYSLIARGARGAGRSIGSAQSQNVQSRSVRGDRPLGLRGVTPAPRRGLRDGRTCERTRLLAFHQRPSERRFERRIC